MVGQFVDVCGTSIGKGFAGAMKRWGFKGLRASHGVSVSHRSHGSTGNRQDPGKVFKGKKMAGHMGDRRVTVQNLEVVGVDRERGLVLVKGARAGRAAAATCGSPMRSSAPCPTEAPHPAGVLQARRPRPAPRRAAAPRSSQMEVAVTTLDQGDAGTIELSPAVFGQPVRSDVLHQVVRWQLAKRRQGTHKTKTRGEVKATTRKMYKQKGTGRARHGAAIAPQFRGGGKAFGPQPARPRRRPAQEGRAGSGSRSRSRASSPTASSWCSIRRRSPSPRPSSWPPGSGSSAGRSVLLIDGPEVDRNFELRGAQPDRRCSCCRRRAPTSTTSCAATSWC